MVKTSETFPSSSHSKDKFDFVFSNIPDADCSSPAGRYNGLDHIMRYETQMVQIGPGWSSELWR